jgi:hypothetical protein
MKITGIIFLLTVSSLHLAAQTNNSPYSLLGIGDIDNDFYNRTSGLANTGIAYRSDRFLLNNNPASFSALTNQVFFGEIGIKGAIVNYYGAGVNPLYNQSSDITFKRLVIAAKIFKHWGTSAGLVPYSSQNVEFNSPEIIQGTNNEIANDYYQGNGGINKVYLANSYEFFNHLSIGVNVSYLFGSLQLKKIIQDANQNELLSENTTTGMTNIYVDYGLQYFTAIGKRWNFSLGATFANKTNLNPISNIVVLASDSTQLLNTGSLLPPTLTQLPLSYGVGIAITRDHKFTLLADYKCQNWSSLNYTFFNYALQNSRRFSVGFEISKNKKVYNNLVETKYLQAGFYYDESYINAYGQQIKDIGGTVGLGINSKRTLLAYVISLQYGVKGKSSEQLIQEKYVNLNLTISFGDIFATKGKKFY